MKSVGEKATEETLEVEIERLLPGGVGLAHAEGLTLFVSLAAPGDVARITIDRISGKVGFASIVEIVKPSPVRIEPPCPYFGVCGGCDFQQLTYEAQLDAKVEIIRDCLHRIAKIETPLDIQIHASPKPWQYRARATWQFDAATKGLGYFVRGSNDVCDVEYCAVLVPELQQTLEQLRNEIPTTQLPRHIDAVAGDESVSVAMGNAGVGNPLVRNPLVRNPLVRNPNATGFNAPLVSRRIGDETYYFSAEGFFQINHDLLEPLIAAAIGDANGKTAVDLYCGVGLFTLPLARRFERVTGVEAHPRAAEFARRNVASAKRGAFENDQLGDDRGSSPTIREGAESKVGTERGGSLTVREGVQNKPGSADLGSAEIVTARVGDWLKQHAGSFGRVDFLLLDPPRTGAENKDIAGILALGPRQISYVSCDPATLARDLKKLTAGGYSLDSVVAFDMFPQTHHVETVTRLFREA